MKQAIILSFFTLLLNINVQAQDATNAVKVFPNPATNVVNIIGILNTSTAQITIRDINGNQVLHHQWRIKNNALNIPISNLKKGIYLISIRSDLQTIQRKFYKQ
ncbi:T9SS type A sorting domain-containing protein [Maribacter sp. LLG6340-A2]|uniref:T9SS type A sorting domain-containing protein n=1 Tax=Maribacter sp. LLG6340-A2 TaxID=3160834 RepID=UPI00386BC5B0